MLSQPPQYAPQFQGGLFGQQPGAFGYDSFQGGAAQHPYAFGAQAPWLTGQFQPGPFQPGSFQQTPFQHNPFQQSPLQQIVPVLGQIAQQIAVQSALTQQIGVALHHLTQQLAVHSLQSQQGIGANRSQTIQ